VDAAAHYRHLLSLGRDEFLAAAAPAALLRRRASEDDAGGIDTQTLERDVDDGFGEETVPHMRVGGDPVVELYPLAKKPGASFPDRITIGRTPNNDVAIADPSVSRLHAYVRPERGRWVVADAGSKNGSWLGGAALDARKERAIASGAVLRLGDVDLTFFLAADLFVALGGS
jgi:hypothetical protein